LVTAARKATTMVRSAGWSWHDVVGRASAGTSGEDLRALLLAVDNRFDLLRSHDKKAFLDVRARFCEAGTLDDADERLLRYLHDLVNPMGRDDDIPF
jgi:hypothetical protein